MDEKKNRADEIREGLKEGLAKLDGVNIDELSDEDLEAVAGGEDMCSLWCCSNKSGEGGTAIE